MSESPQAPVEQIDEDYSSSSRLGPFLVGGVMIAVGAVLCWQVFAIPADGFGVQGPRFFPMLAVLLWLGLALVYLGQHTVGVLRGRGGVAAERFEHRRAAAALVLILVVYANVLDPVGYVVSTTVFFVACARTLGSRDLRRDVTIGLVLSLVVYFSFTRALGVRLPEGFLGL